MVMAFLPRSPAPSWNADETETGRPAMSCADLIRWVLMRNYGWTPEQVADIPDHLLLAVLDA